MTVQADRGIINATLRLLLAPGQVTELRALEVSTPQYRRPHTRSGYFDDPAKLTMAAAEVAPHARAVYFVPNPINPALLARAENRARDVSDRDSTTSDADVVERRWLLIDADPARPAGISSTDDEHELAHIRVQEIRDALTEAGWPLPVYADSGNGAHLLYKIDLPREDGDLVKHCLEALAFRFDDEAVHVDVKVFNPARIWKLYGTPARKGDDTPDRPHRLSCVVDAPENLTVAGRALLEALAGTLPVAATPRRNRIVGAPFDGARWIAEHNLNVLGPRPWQGGQKWLFRVCPWDPSHTDRSAYVIQFADGAMAAGCHHNSCAGKDWHALRDAIEPGWSERRVRLSGPSEPPPDEDLPPEAYAPAKPTSNGTTNGKAHKALALPKIWSASELVQTTWPDPRWAVPGLIPEGLTYLTGAPKIGKSWFCLALGIAVSRGGRVLGQIGVEQGGVLYLALEDRPVRLAKRLEILGFEARPDDPFQLATDWQRMDNGGLVQLHQWLTDHKDTRLVIVDTLAKIRRLNDNPRSVYLEEYQIGDCLKRIADEFSIALLVLHHLRKMKADDPLETISGTFGLTGAADGALILQRTRGQADATLFVTGRDIPEERKIALRFDQATAQWVIVGDAAEYALTKERQAIIKLLSDGQALTPRDVAQMLGKTPVNVKQLMWKMHNEGQIKNVGEGRYTALPKESPKSSERSDYRDYPVTPITQVTPLTVTRVTEVIAVNGVTGVTAESQSTLPEMSEGLCRTCGRPLPPGYLIRCPECLAESKRQRETANDN